MLVIWCNVAVRTAYDHQVHVQIGKICFRDAIGPAASLRRYCTTENRSLDWFSRFKNGQETLEDDQRSGRPSTSRTAEMIEKVQQLIQCDRRMTIVGLEQEVGISHGSIHAILSDDLKMRRVSAKFVARQLTADQMECRMKVAGDLFEKSTQDPKFLTKIVTGDESWVFAYDPETKVHSAEWHTSLSP